ncbi:MAG TPA: winged helix-turn-helix domain-containing protein [Candidatus Elarobacter sp.]
MDAATRYAHEYLLAEPALVVLHAPTGYLKTSTTRIAAQLTAGALIVDCRELRTPGDVAALAGRRQTRRHGACGVTDFLAFENAEAVTGQTAVLDAIHDTLRHRGPSQTIAICTRRPFPLPADLLATALHLGHEDLALDVAEELRGRGLSAERLEEIHRLTLGWPMPAYRLAALAEASPPRIALAGAASRGYERLLQDVRLDFIDRLDPERRRSLCEAHGADREALLAFDEPATRCSLLRSKLSRTDGLLLRDGGRYRIPGIVVAALDAEIAPVAETVAKPEPARAILFDVLSGKVTSNGEALRLPRRELELFANLAIKARHVSYDVLLEEVWGDGGDDHAKLKVTVGRLRKRLGFDSIKSLDAGYAIGENVTCTLAELEELAAAAEPYGAQTIARLEAIRARHRLGMSGIARNWPWYTAWSAKIDAFVEHVDVALARHALAQRRHGAALDCARDAIALNPLSQDAHEVALRALVAQGSTVAARQTLASYAAALHETLAIDPPERLSRIVREIAS